MAMSAPGLGQRPSHSPDELASGELSVAPGDVLSGKYRVTRLIGRGGMGVVAEAERIGVGGRVACKVMHPHYTSNVEAMARFHHEARAAVRIHGEHSARIFDVGTAANGAPFIVMELLDGCDLATMIARGPLPIEEAVLYILQACEGMAEVHANGIIHRDLKPGNLFLTRRVDGTPLLKVLDFGIAKSASPDEVGQPSVTMTLVSLGTPLYMSPEQVRCSKTVDVRTDVWSLGAILYELLAGIPAFHGNTVANISAQVLENTPPALPLLRREVPSRLDKVVQKALSKKPDHRWVNVAAFAAALAPFAGEAGGAHAQRAATILRTVATSSSPSTLPAMAMRTEAETTLRIDRSGRRRLVRRAAVALGVAALVATGLVVATRDDAAVQGAPPQAKKALYATGKARTVFANNAIKASQRAAAPPQEVLGFDPSELPDVVPSARPRATPGRAPVRSGPAPGPLETRK
jgi:serine/threonine protein kinase